ncbi:MAG: hypothetical protein EA421_17395 [Gemmatimonadales bacterium]|jgi:Spy/CpxP family protein refolding chaperone|nr:MAG: hypothetical protein EA421_17395 [Gemmatimonadales bacterium]
MSESTRLRISATAILVLVFGSGILVGLALDRAVTPASGAPSDMTLTTVVLDASEDGAEAEAEASRGYVIHEVTLAPDQRTQVDSILDSYRQQVAEAAEAHRLQYSALAAATRDAFRDILDEAQQAQYDSLLDVRRAERDRAQDGGQNGS